MCIIAPSFADIFYNNCFKNAVSCRLRWRHALVERLLFQEMYATEGYELTVDLERAGQVRITLRCEDVYEFRGGRVSPALPAAGAGRYRSDAGECSGQHPRLRATLARSRLAVAVRRH